METQELRISRLEELATVTANSQTESLRVLQEQSQRLDSIVDRLDDNSGILNEHSKVLQEHSQILREHSKILQEHSKMLLEHSKILREHSRILLDHSRRLENLENLMTRVLEELVAIKEILASSRGMGFAPESDESP